MMNLLTPDTATVLAERYWHIRGDLSVLPSYLDQNFRIRSDTGEYVLKVAHPSWSRDDLDLENHAMMTLAEREPAMQWPRVQLTSTGEHLLTLPIAGQSCHVRMLSFVPGATYAEAIPDISSAQRVVAQQSLGAAVGRLTHALAGFKHAAANRQHPWNLLQLPALQPAVEYLADPTLREVVASQWKAFCQRLPAWRTTLPMAAVHNDANDHNVIVSQDADTFWRVRSIIDFGDMCTSFRLSELAIACTYAMQHESDPVACARNMVRGYLHHATLSRDELALLHGFIVARVCQSILMATQAHHEQPDNDYVLISQQGMQTLLYTLVDIAPEALVAPFLETPHD